MDRFETIHTPNPPKMKHVCLYCRVVFLLTTSCQATTWYSKQAVDTLKQNKQINTTIETLFLFRQARKFDLL